MNRRVVKDMLDVAGVGMSEAESAEIGLRMIDEQVFDIILVDLRMPGMDGITAIDLRERCLAAGADEVIFKPVAMDALFDAMGTILARRSGEDGMIL